MVFKAGCFAWAEIRGSRAGGLSLAGGSGADRGAHFVGGRWCSSTTLSYDSYASASHCVVWHILGWLLRRMGDFVRFQELNPDGGGCSGRWRFAENPPGRHRPLANHAKPAKPTKQTEPPIQADEANEASRISQTSRPTKTAKANIQDNQANQANWASQAKQASQPRQPANPTTQTHQAN